MHITGSTLLDVAIGLIFVFFVFSMFVSGIVELVNTFLEQRAKLLRIALTKLLGPLTDDFFNHHLIKVKEEKFWGFLKPVNYLSANSFSTVLIDLLVKPNAVLAPESSSVEQTFEKIRQLVDQPGYQTISELLRPILVKSNSFQTFTDELEIWYNGYMEQVSGWFKRYAQGVVWIVAGLVVIGLNVDTIYLTNRLIRDNGFRERLVNAAIQTTQDGRKSWAMDAEFGAYLHKYDSLLTQADSSNSKRYIVNPTLTATDKLVVQGVYTQFLQDRIADLQLPIGWEMKQAGLGLQPGQTFLTTMLGWLLTTAALSFGAPFWFDLLLKLVNIRNTARRPPGNPDPTKT